MNTDNIYKQVYTFNYLFGVISTPYNELTPDINSDLFNANSCNFNESQVKLRHKLINEEINETIHAINNNDVIEIIDGLCDMLYVLFGAVVYFNLPIANINNEISKYINTDLDQFSTNVDDIFTTNVLNIINTDSAEFINSINIIVNHNHLLEQMTLQILEDPDYYRDHIQNYQIIIDEIILNVYIIAQLLNININHFFNIIHNSNMSKICNTEQEAINTIEWYLQNETRYKEPSFREIIYQDDKYYIVYDRDTGKILKSINYIPVTF